MVPVEAGEVEGGTNVGPDLSEEGDSFDLCRANQKLMDLSDLLETPLGVALGYLVGGAVLAELVGGELADRLQQSEEPAERSGLDGEHGLLDQVFQQVVDVNTVQILVGGQAYC